MPQREIDNYGYREKTSAESHGPERDFHLLDSKDTFKMGDETKRFFGELSGKPLSDLLDQYQKELGDSIFSMDSYTGIERTSTFTGLDLGIRVGVGLSLKGGFVVDNLTNAKGLRICLEFFRGAGVGVSVWEYSPYTQGGVPSGLNFEVQNQVEAYAALGIGPKISSDLSKSASLSMVVGGGYGAGVSLQGCLTQRVRFDNAHTNQLFQHYKLP